jgi:choline-glycine betaine transporter
MSIDTSSNIGNGALLTSGAGGIVTAINEYSIIIGLSLTLISIIIGLIFHIRADRWRKQESARNRAELTREIMKELEKEKSNKPD